VTIVVDGDTVYASLNGREEKVRFIGVDTPESTREVEPYCKEASAYTQQRLAGRQVYLELDVGERDKYGRLLAYVWLEQPNSTAEQEVRAKMYNAELLLNGYAQVMTVPPNVKYADLFVKLQREAGEAGKGLWGAAVTAPAPAPAGGGDAGGAGKYIGNSNSKKFHYPDCRWAKEISPANRLEFTSRQEAISAGYQPCKVCKP
jgi:micrococcal nuclease